MYESPLIKMQQQIKIREGNSYLSMLIKALTKHLEKKGGKPSLSMLIKGTSIWKKKKRERKLMSGHAHKRHQRLESKERFKICTKHVHYCKKNKNKNKK